MKRASIVLLIILLWGCSRGSKSHAILDEDQFASIYIALLDSTHHIRAGVVDSLAHPVAVRILQRHGATVEQFKATIAYYNSNTNQWKDFLQRVIQKLEERRRKKSDQR